MDLTTRHESSVTEKLETLAPTSFDKSGAFGQNPSQKPGSISLSEEKSGALSSTQCQEKGHFSTFAEKPAALSPTPFETSGQISAVADIPEKSGLGLSAFPTPEKPIEPQRRYGTKNVSISSKEAEKIGAKTCKLTRDHENVPCFEGSLIDQAGKSKSALRSNKNKGTKLPEKYEMLAEFMVSMECSIRLLRLKNTITSFTNIRSQVETLTKRRFTYAHLAQIKYVMGAGIELKKILSHDERTLCMKPDLLITLQPNALKTSSETQKLGIESLIFRKVFRARLSEFFKSHPKGDEIPEETLPEPFNQTKTSILPHITSSLSPALSQPSGPLPMAISSHFSASFRPHFSQRVKKTHLDLGPLEPLTENCSIQKPFEKEKASSSDSSVPLDPLSTCQTSEKESLGPDSPKFEMLLSRNPNLHSLGTPHKLKSPPKVQPLPSKMLEKSEQKRVENVENTPVKLVSTPIRLMTRTPELETPKRLRPGSDDNVITTDIDSTKRSIRTRSLNFNSPIKNSTLAKEERRSGVDEEIIKSLPASFWDSIREKEKKAMEAKAAVDKSQGMVASLPKLYDMIRLIFQGMNRSVLTKQELVHRLTVNHPEIIDRREIEEQLKLLQELVPDWITGKMASSGDFLYSVRAITDPASVHARLKEAL
ncbi:CDT1-like protein a, chloroplastic isoform X1 [Amborella trichopoda]|uniref:CDT1 Geminin-binding domain-containing protein n=1 Tax=Amborella trichopoda TaxID=13333 RepID=W1NGJ2_AMBTC|nr:CDT1-like protein a, chloroplastic isoform X1 [Amborella trichopoda]ERM94912.1 hypothetical protein AMTR_s00009p00169560 [Amborella trichopoda]|eukprot:XP_020524660.1 CDT1-like protein a, chloroplastic isoform X1 [Amborella trichopoda]